MGLPDVSITVIDGSLATGNASAAQTAQTFALVGCSTGGSPGTAYGFGDMATLQSTLGAGPLVEAAAAVLEAAGGTVICAPVTNSFGVASAVTHTGTGSATMAVSFMHTQPILITIVASGAVATATFTYQIGSGPVSAVITTAATYAVPGTNVILAFSNADGNMDDGDTYLFSTKALTAVAGDANGTNGITWTGGGGFATNVEISSAGPIQGTSGVVVSVVAGGALGTGTFSYSVDAGKTTSGVFTTGGGAYTPGQFAIPGAGIVITFSGTITTGDTYTFAVSDPTFTTTNMTTAMNAAANSTFARQFSMFWIVTGDHWSNQTTGVTYTTAEALAAVVDTNLTTYAGTHQYYRALTECPWDLSHNTDANDSGAFAPFASTRVGVGVGHAALASPITGNLPLRNASWCAAQRLASIQPGISGAKVALGGCPGVASIDRDERATPGLNAARFVTLRTFTAKQGFFITLANLMAGVGSDFSEFQYGRVMDMACGITYGGMLNYLNSNVRTNANGTIYEVDAQSIEHDLDSQLVQTLGSNVSNTSAAPGAVLVVSRTQNIASTKTLPVTVTVNVLGYLEQITATLAFGL